MSPRNLESPINISRCYTRIDKTNIPSIGGYKKVKAVWCDVRGRATASHGLNSKQQHHRTIVVALQLTKAFDTVSHTKLLQDIYD